MNMIDNKTIERVTRKLGDEISLSTQVFLFSVFDKKNEVLKILYENNFELDQSEIFLIYIVSLEYFVLIIKDQFLLYSKSVLHSIVFLEVKQIKINPTPYFETKDKSMINTISIFTIANKSFPIEFKNQNELFLFHRIVENLF